MAPRLSLSTWSLIIFRPFATELTQKRTGARNKSAWACQQDCTCRRCGSLSADFSNRSCIAERTRTIHERRPTRSEDVLDYYRDTVHYIPHPLVYAPDGYDDRGGGRLPGICPRRLWLPAESYPENGRPARQWTANLNAIQRRFRDQRVLRMSGNSSDRLEAYGILPSDYIRIAEPAARRSTIAPV